MLAVLVLPLLAVQVLQERWGNLNLIPNLSLMPRVAVYTTMAICITALGSFGAQDFIYFQF